MVEVRRKKGETFESLYRRFSRRIQQSRKLFLARKLRYKERPKSRNERRKSALFKLSEKAKIEYLRKSGKLKDDLDKKSYYKNK